MMNTPFSFVALGTKEGYTPHPTVIYRDSFDEGA